MFIFNFYQTMAVLLSTLLLLMLMIRFSSLFPLLSSTDASTTINNTKTRVLFLFFHDKGSHFQSMQTFMKALTKNGHSVSVFYTMDVEGVPNVPDLNFIKARIHDEYDPGLFQRFFWNETLSSMILPALFGAHGDALLGELMREHPIELKELLEVDWDLVVVDDLFWALGFALPTLRYRLWEKDGGSQRKKEPRFAVFSTAGQTLQSAEIVKSMGRNWVMKAPLYPFLPTDESDVYQPNRFTHRLFSFYENIVELVLMNYLVEGFLLPNIAKFGVPNFSWSEFYQRSAIQFTDTIDRLGWPQSTAPEVVGIGANCKQPGELPSTFRDFVEDPTSKGTIYIAFGTYPDWNYAPKRITDALFGAINRLTDYRIIFVYSGPPVEVGSHVRLIEWAPQLEILSHPKTLAFVTHGGLKSIKEGICASTPLIVMPAFAEQGHNAHLALAHGFAKVINKYTLTADSVHRTILSVLSNPVAAKERAEKVRAIFLDRPIPALDEGVFAIERLLRQPSGRRISFRRKGMELDWASFCYAEYFVLLFAVILSVFS